MNICLLMIQVLTQNKTVIAIYGNMPELQYLETLAEHCSKTLPYQLLCVKDKARTNNDIDKKTSYTRGRLLASGEIMCWSSNETHWTHYWTGHTNDRSSWKRDPKGWVACSALSICNLPTSPPPNWKQVHNHLSFNSKSWTNGCLAQSLQVDSLFT